MRSMLELLRQQLKDPELIKQQKVQTLWSGYGEIARYYSPNNRCSVIVKHISPPDSGAVMQHPRGWQSDASHQRKLHSYQVERVFYGSYAKQCDAQCRVAHLLGLAESAQMLILEDLDASGFEARRHTLSLSEIQQILKWLAHFHARFLQSSVDGLWPIGSYWHLATRQQEWSSMADGRLKAQAGSIDKRLNQAQFQTLIHGDAKVANFCFDAHNKRVAAVDFQYVGRGCGVKDVVYFFTSCLDDNRLFEMGESLWNDYFSMLQGALKQYGNPVDYQALEAEWRQLIPYAWADFYRFLLGWAPDHHKINPYMASQADSITS